MKKLNKAVVNTLSILAAGAFALSATAAPSVEKLTLTPATGAKVGDKVTATVDFKDAGEGLCAIEVEFGDGTRETFKIKPETKLPITVEHTYKAAGELKVRAAGAKVENAFGCAGKEIATYQVSAASAAALAAGNCPADWSLKGKPAKNGAFTCVPKKGVKDAAKPAKPLDCPSGTSYFTKGKTLGCEAGN
ncbi:MAG TPA: hypothetical protein VFF03_12705 [Rhodocyclaceae bacterium]|nr:hypothetical protein [Rhodocyclaceae bacterium]